MSGELTPVWYQNLCGFIKGEFLRRAANEGL